MITDSILHIVLGIALAAIIIVLVWLLPDITAAFVFAAFVIYFREVTQKQGSTYNDDFAHGWAFWKWSAEKNLETWVPVATLIVLGIIGGVAL
jgi:hypothetical protein